MCVTIRVCSYVVQEQKMAKYDLPVRQNIMQLLK